MLKRIIFIIAFAIFSEQGLYAGQNFTFVNKSILEEVDKEIIIDSPQTRLPENEYLKYTVRWLGIPVGYITASIKGVRILNNRQAYVLEVVVKTNAFCSAIYKIDDRYLSYMDVEDFYTLRHEVYRREGRYKKDAITDFDQVNHRAHFKNLLDGSEKDFDIPPGVQDTLSACYYFRLLDIEQGDRVKYFVVNNEKNYELFGVVEKKKFIKIKDIGNYESFFIQPYAKELGGEEVRKGKVSGYFNADQDRIPLLAIVEAPLFTKVTVSLSKIE